ncbi:MAG: beta-N-acetylhexosaminidase, partial [Muribaculaceae bacterium]|nr:beta-N-acetylhexosaminidase [Muribaculaceae bacterium]
MKKIFVALSLTLAALSASADYALLPVPAAMTETEGSYTVPAKGLTVSGPGSKTFARDLGRRGVEAGTASKGASVVLSADASIPAEGYAIGVTPDGISVKASAPAGFYYAAQTLAQMVRQNPDGLPAVEIADSPRFGYRGMMLDVVRCFIHVDELKKLIDEAAALKINNVHLHLTDDNGWRLEIKKYPKLTDVGAWRVDRPEIFPARLNARSPEERATYGGFYTQKQMRDLVKYAAERHVNLIPEIELPAHAAAAIASYPELTCPVDSGKFIGVFPGIGGKDASIIMCGGNDKVIDFYKDVLDEVMAVFPSEHIHLGGDEAAKDRWQRCPLCQDRIKKLGLKDEEELQSWLMNTVSDHLLRNGRVPMGWDEATYGDLNKEMVVYGWQGNGQVAVENARESGRKFIMTPARKFYLIRYQG